LGNSRTIPASRFTGSVTAPGSFTSALIRQRIPKSRFVVVSEIWSFSASINTLLKIGIVALEPTTLSTWARPFAKWSRLILNFMRSALESGGN
jgi:hypothetical protein